MFKKLAALLFVGGIFIAAPIAAAPTLINSAYERSSIMEQVFNAVNDVAMEYPEVRGVKIVSKPIMPGVYAFAGDGKITFNSLYTSKTSLFNSMVRDDVKMGFHPHLGHCTPAELLAIHESAHIIDQTRNRAPKIALIRMFRVVPRDLAGYSYNEGALNPGEALAEAFASVKCNGGNATERKIAALIG